MHNPNQTVVGACHDELSVRNFFLSTRASSNEKDTVSLESAPQIFLWHLFIFSFTRAQQDLQLFFVPFCPNFVFENVKESAF